MGQQASTPKFNGTALPQQPGRHLRSFHEERLDQLREQLARLADALALVEASHADSVDVDDNAGEPAGDGDNSFISHETHSQSAASSTGFLLEPFEQVLLAGYKLGDDALTHSFQLSPDEPPANALYLLGRNTALSVLDLSFNNLTSAIVEPLLQAIAELPTLTVLRLSGNALGSASKRPIVLDSTENTSAQKENSSDVALSLVSDNSSDEVLRVAQTPAAQLGRWLATNPPLQELSLYQCELNDYDVQALLRGLTRLDDTAAPSPLLSLQLAGNLACTWRSAQMALQLVKDLGNTTLRAVELESAPPDTAVRFEYACTSDGHFRSGKTLISQVDEKEGAAVAAIEAAAVPEETLRELTPGQSSRFRCRRRHLRYELDGARVMLPALMGELHAILSARRAAAAEAEAEKEAAAALAVAEAAAAAVKDTSVDATPQEEEVKVEETKMDSGDGNDRQEVVMEAAAAEDEDRVHAASAEATEEAPRAAEDDATLLNTAGTATDKSASRPTTKPLFLTRARPHQTPQERRAARFETPERIARVMFEARAYRRHIHPPQVDTYAPPCSDVHTCSTSGQYGSENAATTWYAQEGFVLRPNGLSNVLVAPVLSGVASARRNVLLEEVMDRPLQACWCTPRNATSAAGYAGILHYHCVRERDPVRHNGGAALETATSRKAQSQKKDATVTATAAAGVTQLPPLASTGSPTAVAGSPLHDGAARTYRACCGTGHSCLSASVAMGGPLRAQRMRTALLTKSFKGAPSLSLSLPTGEARPASSQGDVASRKSGAVRRPVHARTFSAFSLSSRASEGMRESMTGTTMFGGAQTVLKTTNGLSVAVNYNPVAFFASPHVSCAAGIQMEECS